MSRKADKKRFVSKAEEAAWWEANEERIASAFENALTNGYVGPCRLIVTGDSTVAKIRLSSRDAAKVREQAAERGSGFHVYLKMIIHEALRKEERRHTKSAR